MTSRFRIFFAIVVIVIAIASMAMMLAVSNRSNPDAAAEPTVAGEAVAQEGGGAAPEAAAQDPIRVTNDIPVNDIIVSVAPLNTEEIVLLPVGDVQIVTGEQPAQEQAAPEAAPEQQAEQPAEQAPAETAPTEVPTQVPAPTAVPTAAPDAQPVVVGDAQRNTAVSEFITIQYTVVAGDTMYNISQRDGFNTTVEFMQRHGFSTSEMIAGAVVNIPVVNPEYCINSTPHIVLLKENAFRISLNAGTDVPTLAALNGLIDPTVLSVGQLLCVP